MTPDRPTRMAVDLIESAAVEGARQSRSAKQQLDHWARVGRTVSMHETAARGRIEAVLAGTMPLSDLTPQEQAFANAEIDASVQARARSMSFGQVLAAEGVTTVALDAEGRLVEHRPDGSTSVLG